MNAALMLVAFGALWWHFAAAGAGVRAAFMFACLSVGAYIVALTELLSLAGRLAPLWVGLGWVALVLIVALGRLGAPVPRYRLATQIMRAVEAVRHDRTIVVYAAGMALIALVTGMIATLAPINNWDSMTYHLPRVMHWLQRASVDHYPTHLPRQLYQSPFAEYAILHTIALSGGDGLASFVQWFSLMGCAVGVSLIAQRLGGGSRATWLAALWVMTLPMAILQASGTQNDLVLALWLVALAWTVAGFLDAPTPASAGWVGIALGLAVLTKGTAYMLAFPLAVWFGVATLREMGRTAWRPFLIVTVLFLSINSGHYGRNWETFGTPLGAAEGYANETFRPAVFVSNGLRNLTLNATTPFERLNYQVFFRPVRWLHNNALPVGLHDFRTTYLGLSYQQNYINASEDTAPNPAHFFLAFGVGTVFVVRALGGSRPPRRAWVYLAVIGGVFVMFSWLLKWQIWNTRLLLPAFILFGPWAAVEVARWRNRWVGRALGLGLLALSVPYLLLSCNRPVLSVDAPPFTCGRASVFAPEQAQTFNSRGGVLAPYVATAGALNDVACLDVGLVLGGDSWEYPIWTLLEGERNLYHINVGNRSALARAGSPGEVCAVFASPATDEAFTWNGVRYERVQFSGTAPDSAGAYLPVTGD